VAHASAGARVARGAPGGEEAADLGARPAGRGHAALIDALETLGPLAEAAVVTTLRHALQAGAEAFVRAETERLGVAVPRPGERPGPA
jgi:hypothetical protein